MPFTVQLEHRDFFEKNKFIELEELFSVEQVDVLNRHLDQALSNRTKTRKEARTQTQTQTQFVDGYDMWREDAQIKKITQKHNIAEVVAEIFRTTPLRIAFDLFLAAGHTSPFSKELPLTESSCLQPLTGALLLQLSDSTGEVSGFPLPSKKGNVLIISPQFPIPWPTLFATPGIRLFMMGFGGQKTLYRAEIKDPHAPFLKKLGYVYGDFLKDSSHPLLVRK
ncbi:MAG: hypothetical protein V4492_00875 [Chlamydiota bacterium]